LRFQRLSVGRQTQTIVSARWLNYLTGNKNAQTEKTEMQAVGSVMSDAVNEAAGAGWSA
jgi:hypothetical protein